MIKAKIVADSINIQEDRITSLLITFPRIILAELNTHRMLSKNSASSRAIPFEKMVESVQNNPFIPIAWQKEHKGMQGTEYVTDKIFIDLMNQEWLIARNATVLSAKRLNSGKIATDDLDLLGKYEPVTKQLCNRLLEPFMYHTVLITGNVNSEAWLNFFDLRCPQYTTPVSGEGFYAKSWKELQSWHSNPENEKILEDNKNNILFKLQHNKGLAEIHMMQLAECIYDAVQESTPKQLKAGEWHIPFEDKISKEITILTEETVDKYSDDGNYLEYLIQQNRIKISTSMCARTSYTVVGDEKEVSYKKHIELYEKLINQKPLHASPMEHCARVMTDEEYESYYKGFGANKNHTGIINNQGWCRNYKGFIQLREILENEQSK